MTQPDKPRGAGPRSQYLHAGREPGHANRLVDESSPYLLAHAHNPVDWYPWGDAAFAKARRDDKPVFLSIGYSTCHWCHVMAEESFEDQQVAAALNRGFVAVKVDREQRPDLDDIYMTGTTLMSGRGGWPMSCFLTPAGKPFFGATYFPREQFLALLEQVRRTWQTRRRHLLADADKLDEGIRRQLAPTAAARLPRDLVERAAGALVEHADTVWGGFGDAPKFPQEPNLLFLLDEVQRDTRALGAQPIWTTVCRALDAMRAGGIHDQIGGGFHRYATDREWRIPHFEKMLYNQGQLARVYTRAWQVGGQARYRHVVERTLDYVLREMRAADGGFYSATDADSEGVEGRYFVWRYAELAELLEPDALGLCERVFGVTPAGNFDGANVLYQPQTLEAAAAALDTTPAALDQRVAAIRARLYQARRQRAAPLRDDKLITEDNATTIAALADAGRALGRADYIAAAARAAAAIIRRHHDQPARRLWRTSLYGATSAPAQLADYAHLIDAMIALYDATTERSWLANARILLDEARLHFLDTEGGGFFGAPGQTDGPQLLRGKPLLDGATISGNSLLLPVLVALDARTGDADLAALIEQQIDAFSGLIGRAPLAGPVFLLGLRQRASPTPASLQYIAGGAIRAVCEAESVDADTVRVALTLDIGAGWHIQAHDAEPSAATRLVIANADAWQRLSADYPPGQRGAEAGPQAVPVLAGRVVIGLTARRLARGPLRLALQLQPCTQRECAPAAHAEFVVHHLA